MGRHKASCPPHCRLAGLLWEDRDLTCSLQKSCRQLRQGVSSGKFSADAQTHIPYSLTTRVHMCTPNPTRATLNSRFPQTCSANTLLYLRVGRATFSGAQVLNKPQPVSPNPAPHLLRDLTSCLQNPTRLLSNQDHLSVTRTGLSLSPCLRLQPALNTASQVTLAVTSRAISPHTAQSPEMTPHVPGTFQTPHITSPGPAPATPARGSCCRSCTLKPRHLPLPPARLRSVATSCSALLHAARVAALPPRLPSACTHPRARPEAPQRRPETPNKREGLGSTVPGPRRGPPRRGVDQDADTLRSPGRGARVGPIRTPGGSARRPRLGSRGSFGLRLRLGIKARGQELIHRQLRQAPAGPDRGSRLPARPPGARPRCPGAGGRERSPSDTDPRVA